MAIRMVVEINVHGEYEGNRRQQCGRACEFVYRAAGMSRACSHDQL
jgi:hypothetical protein